MINVLVQGKSTVEPLVVYHLLLECHVSCHFSLKQQVQGSVASNWVIADVLAQYIARLRSSKLRSISLLLSSGNDLFS